MLDVELAKSIKVVCIKPPPDEYESFMYLWTCLDTGKMYLGIHKVNKRVYWHSSTSKEFNNAVANPDSNYKYEVIDYGMHGEMATKEFNMLTEVDARNNDKWWNKSNGIPNTTIVNDSLVDDLLSRINNIEWLTNGVTALELRKLNKIQVRETEFDTDLVNHIRDSVDDAGGNVDLTDPPVVLEKRSAGDDVLLNGNHTVEGVSDSKHGGSVPLDYQLVPYDVHSKLNDLEIECLGNYLNPQPKVRKLPSQKADMVKHLVSRCENSDNPLKSVDSSSNRDFLKNMNQNSKQIKSILDKVSDVIETNTARDRGQTFANYAVGLGHDALNSLRDSLQTAKTLCVYYTSSKVMLDRIFHQMHIAGKQKCTVLIYHTSPSAERAWNMTAYPKLLLVLDGLQSNLPDFKKKYDITFQPMRSWLPANPDGTVKRWNI